MPSPHDTNKWRKSEPFFRKYEAILALAIEARENFAYICPEPSAERGENKRLMGSTLAVNLSFALRTYMELANLVSEHFTRESATSFRSQFIFVPHGTDRYCVLARRNKSAYTALSNQRIIKPQLAPANEGARIASLGLSVNDLSLFTAVVRCISEGLLTVPIQLTGQLSVVHRTIIEEHQLVHKVQIETAYMDETDTTFLVPYTPST